MPIFVPNNGNVNFQLQSFTPNNGSVNFVLTEAPPPTGIPFRTGQGSPIIARLSGPGSPVIMRGAPI